jgi:hypothetical protein
MKVLDQKTRTYHSGSIVHCPLLQELTHRGVDEWDSRLASSPAPKSFFGPLPTVPLKARHLRLERVSNRMWCREEDVGVKLSPADLGAKGGSPTSSSLRRGQDGSWMNTAKAEVGPKA